MALEQHTVHSRCTHGNHWLRISLAELSSVDIQMILCVISKHIPQVAEMCWALWQVTPFFYPALTLKLPLSWLNGITGNLNIMAQSVLISCVCFQNQHPDISNEHLSVLSDYHMFVFVFPGPCVRLRSRQWWKLEPLLGKTQRQKVQNWITSWNSWVQYHPEASGETNTQVLWRALMFLS